MTALLGAATAASAAPTVYVTNNNSNTVTPIDVATNTARAAIPVGMSPSGIAVTPDGATAYVANNTSGTVTPIDVATNTAGTPISGLNFPFGVAVTPDGATAYVTNQGGTVTPIDVATNTAGAAIPVGMSPSGIAVTPDGATAYVATADVNQAGNNFVTPIDVATNTAGATIEVGTTPTGIAVTPDGATAYVANLNSNSVTPIDVATNTAGAAIPVVTPSGIAVTPDGASAYVTNRGSGTVTQIDVATNNAVSTPPVGASPTGIAITPDGTTAYVANGGSGTVTPIDVATNNAGPPIAVGSGPSGVAVTPTISATLDPAALAFGERLVDAGPTFARTVSVESTGSGNLTPSAPAIAGPDAGQFAISADTCAGASLTPGQKCSVSVTFDPSVAGAKAATLRIPSNDPNSPSTVALSGSGTTPPAPLGPPPPAPLGPPGASPEPAGLAQLGPPEGGEACAPVSEPAPSPGPLVNFTLSAEQFVINQRIYQAAIRRVNAVKGWLAAGIEARDICGGALGVDRFLGSVGFVPANGDKPVANPRPIQVAARGSRSGRVTDSAEQALINQRVAQVAILRANALAERIDGQLTGGDLEAGQLTNGQLVAGLGFGDPGTAASAPASVARVAERQDGDPGAVTLSKNQLVINHRIGVEAVRRVNRIVANLERGLVADNFAPGTIGGAAVAGP